MAQDTFGDVAAVVAGKPDAGVRSANYHKSELPVTTNAQILDEPRVWLGILQDLILSARKAGLEIEPYDMRPDDNACAVVMPGVFYCADCGNFSRGNGCGNGCGKGVEHG